MAGRRREADEFAFESPPRRNPSSSVTLQATAAPPNLEFQVPSRGQEHLPFTPPPYYVAARDLPRKNTVRAQASTADASSSTGTNMSRQRSNARSRREADGRVQKGTKKKHRPGLSINTDVSRHIAAPPRELAVSHAAHGVPERQDSVMRYVQADRARRGNGPSPSWRQRISPAAYQTLPDMAIDGVSRPQSTSSPSRYPTTYLDRSRAASVRSNQRPKDLYFAPPPQPRVPSSVYSRATRYSFARSDGSRRFSFKRRTSGAQSNTRDSTATTFEEDEDIRRRQRTFSEATMFEEDTPNRRSRDVPPDTANTITPHRSRGWWNVITTPFEGSRSHSQAFRTPTADRSQTPDVPPLPTLVMDSGRLVAVPLSQFNRPQSRHDSIQSSNFDATSPNDREVPIVLGGDLNIAVQAESHPSRNPSLNAVASQPIQSGAYLQGNRMPFADVGKSPLSGGSEFSPSGIVTGEGQVQSSRGVISTGLPAESSSRVVASSSNVATEQQGSNRSSLVANIVRFPTVRSPQQAFYPEQQARYNHPSPRVIIQQANRERAAAPLPVFSPPPPTQVYLYEYEKEPVKPEKKSKRMCLIWPIKKGKKDKNNTDGKDAKVNKDGKKTSRRRKCCICLSCCMIFFLILLILIIVLAVMLSRKKANQAASANQPKWLNITNFPGVPTGALTVARPDLKQNESGCVNPTTVWSCAVPKEQQSSIKPNDPDQPNFVIDIRFDNSSTSSTSFNAKRSGSGAAMASNFLTARSLDLKNIFRRALFPPSPAPPTLEEQAFLGQTTDNNTAPFEGESTPFLISFDVPGNPTPTTTTGLNRRDATPTQSGNSIPNIATAIPIPSLNPDSTPPPANLLPFPSFQPLRLYNRGRYDEHYGFYVYYDRNIFMKSITIQNATEQAQGSIPADENGGSTFDGATARCTWRDTRFKVQIWTRLTNATLLSHASSGSKLSGGDFARPGTFPYPVTVTLDRHGGGLTTKMLFCYGMDNRGRIDINSRVFQGEQRGFGGKLVNPALGPFDSVNVTKADGGPGGIDGGSGGCGCQWANWSTQ